MRIQADRRGFTLTELMTVVTLFSAIAVCTFGALIMTMRKSDGSATQVYADADAVSAMGRVVQDVREAKTVTLLDSGARLSILFPVRTADGYYDRHTADTANEVQYYRSNSTGNVGTAGDWLWRSAAGVKQVVKRSVSNLLFEQDTDERRAVKVTIETYGNSVDNINPVKRTELTQRVVYLRNY